MNLNNFLKKYKINASLQNTTESANVTTYFLKIEEGEKINKILKLEKELQLFLKSKKINIIVNAETQSIAIETPRIDRQTLLLKDFINKPEFQNTSSKTSFIVGEDLQKNTIIADIAKMPHLLIAGSTGSGKSIFVNNLILSILEKSTPEDTRLILIDPKIVELSIYNNVRYLLTPVVTDTAKTIQVLEWAVEEMERRYLTLAKNSVRNIDEYNKKCDKMYKIIIVIDELADLMLQSGVEIENLICRLAQKARAAGIHLILATQRPSVDVITGLIKANVPSRIAFTTSSKIDSRIILDEPGAEKLTGKGDLLFKPIGSFEPIRCQAPYISDDEIKKELEKYKTDKPNFIEFKKEAKIIYNDTDFDSLIEEAKKLKNATCEDLQQFFRIGEGRAKRILLDLKKEV